MRPIKPRTHIGMHVRAGRPRAAQIARFGHKPGNRTRSYVVDQIGGYTRGRNSLVDYAV